MLDSPRACSKRCRAVTRISMAIRSRLAAAEDMRGIIEGDSLFSAKSAALLCVLRAQKLLSLRLRRKPAEIVEKRCLSEYFRDPGFNRFPQLSQSAFEEVIGAFDNHQLLRLRKRSHDCFKFCARSELIAVAAHEQLGFQASVKELEIIGSIVDCADRQTKRDQRSHARIGTGHAQSHRSAKGKS